jgi:hypothetical protein
MKKFVLLICSLCILVFGIAHVKAQTTSAEQISTFNTSENKVNLVSLDVLRFLGFYNLSYTRAFSPALSLTLELETPTNFLLGSIIQETGFGGRLEGRWNVAQKNLLGIYIAPVVGFNSSTFRAGSALTQSTGTSNYSATVTWFALGAMAGYQFAPFAGLPELLAGFGIGAEYNFINGTTSGTGSAPTGTTVPTGGNIVYPRLRATIGYAW